MSANVQLWVGVAFGVLFVIFGFIALSGIRSGADDRTKWNGAIAFICLLLIYFSDGGNGLYSRAIYSKETRAVWSAEYALQQKVYQDTHSYRVYCPEVKALSVWTGKDMDDWHLLYGKVKNLKLLPGSATCYIYRE